MGQDEQILAKSPELRIGLAKEITQEDVQPLLHGLEGEKLLTSALKGQEGLKLLKNDITYNKADEREKWRIIY